MKKILGLLAASTLFATAAHATVTTIAYTPTEGEAITVAYDDAAMTSTNVATGESGAYTYDEATGTVCGSSAGSEVCVTFENPGSEVGHETNFSTNDGRSGTAKIISVE